MFSYLKWLIYEEKLRSFSLYSSDSLISSRSASIRDFSFTLYKLQELRTLFVDTQ